MKNQRIRINGYRHPHYFQKDCAKSIFFKYTLHQSLLIINDSLMPQLANPPVLELQKPLHCPRQSSSFGLLQSPEARDPCYLQGAQFHRHLIRKKIHTICHWHYSIGTHLIINLAIRTLLSPSVGLRAPNRSKLILAI